MKLPGNLAAIGANTPQQAAGYLDGSAALSSSLQATGNYTLEIKNRAFLYERYRWIHPARTSKTADFGIEPVYIFGRRKGFYNESDHQKGGYIDHYSPKLFIVLVVILGLNVLDVILTMIILEHRGSEVNPVVRSAIEVYGERFWVWKYGIVSTCLLLLCLHIKFKGVKTIIILICSIYFTVVLYQIFLITKHVPVTF